MLSDIIRREIEINGPMTVGAFMALALGHPRYGYYMNRDPLGAAGDFTTAPEISQMFGELIGAWVANVWQAIGRPSKFTLAEAGPGRGTLMQDMLRATRKIDGFHDAMIMHLLETSPALRERQRGALEGYTVTWHEDPNEWLKAGDGPIIIVANEFLDALPVRQMQKQDGRWHERMVTVDTEGALVFGLGPVDPSLEALIPRLLHNKARDGDVFEFAPVRSDFMARACAALKHRGGAMLLIDYGHDPAGLGDTLQAVKNHAYSPVLNQPGQADLTAHVDFSALARIARAGGCAVQGPVGQGAFLESLGIGHRAAVLIKAGAKALDMEAALQRLTAPEAMGALFKVMAVMVDRDVMPEGFKF